MKMNKDILNLEQTIDLLFQTEDLLLNQYKTAKGIKISPQVYNELRSILHEIRTKVDITTERLHQRDLHIIRRSV